MRVEERCVGVKMGVRLTAVPSELVLMAVMIIVDVRVRMRHGIVIVRVLMVLGEMQPNPCGHASERRPESRTGMFTKEPQRQRSTDEGAVAK